jgi:hypothetical protein
MGIENFTPEIDKGFADIIEARQYGYSKMGQAGFDNFVSQFQSNDLAIKTINGRLATRNNNVHIPAAVNSPEELALAQAGIISALDNPEMCVAAIISEYQDRVDLESLLEIQKMGGKMFYEDSIDRLDLLAYCQSLDKSLLLISQPTVISQELSQTHFGYRWPVEFNPHTEAWHVGQVEVVTKMQIT